MHQVRLDLLGVIRHGGGMVGVVLTFQPQHHGRAVAAQISPPLILHGRKAVDGSALAHIAHGGSELAATLSSRECNQHDALAPQEMEGRAQQKAHHGVNNCKQGLRDFHVGFDCILVDVYSLRVRGRIVPELRRRSLKLPPPSEYNPRMQQTDRQSDTAPRLVMVLGSSHSGTTMLDLMLGNHDATFSTGEVWAAFHPWRKHHFDPTHGCSEQTREVWDKLLGVPEAEFHHAAATQPGMNNVVDSSKDLSWVIDAVAHTRRAGMQMYNVVVWKEPIELAYSYFKRERSMQRFRSQYLTYYERFLDTRLPFFAVRFSQLVAEPASTVRQICELTGLPWQEKQEEFWRKDHHHLFGAHKTGKQSRAGASKIAASIDYPEEFLQVFDEFCRSFTHDKRLMRVVGSLDAMDINKIYVQRMRSLGEITEVHKPYWYYTHKLKRIYYRYFPETYRPTAADLN